LVAFDRISIVTLNDLQDSVITTYASGVDLPGIQEGTITPLHNSIAKKAIESKRVTSFGQEDILSHNKAAGLNNIEVDADMTSLLIAPLIWQNGVIGAVYFRRSNPHPFPPADIEFGAQIAAQISGAVENARLLH
jgi:GAF domain-containing protein